MVLGKSTLKHHGINKTTQIRKQIKINCNAISIGEAWTSPAGPDWQVSRDKKGNIFQKEKDEKRTTL